MSWRQSSVAPPPLSEKNALPSAPPTGPSVLPYVTWLHCCGIIHSIAAVAPCGWFTARYKNTGEAVAVHPSVRPLSVIFMAEWSRLTMLLRRRRRGPSRRASQPIGTLFLLWLEGSGSPPLSSPFPHCSVGRLGQKLGEHRSDFTGRGRYATNPRCYFGPVGEGI